MLLAQVSSVAAQSRNAAFPLQVESVPSTFSALSIMKLQAALSVKSTTPLSVVVYSPASRS